MIGLGIDLGGDALRGWDGKIHITSLGQYEKTPFRITAIYKIN